MPEPGPQGGRRQLYCSKGHRELAQRQRSIDREAERITSEKIAELELQMADAERDLRTRLSEVLTLLRQVNQLSGFVTARQETFWKLHRGALTARAAALVPQLVTKQALLEERLEAADRRMSALFGPSDASGDPSSAQGREFES